MSPTLAAPQADPASLILFEAIARQRQVSAVYNSMAVQLAPHVLYTRADMLYLGAVVTRRRGAPVPEAKLGIFKVAGLGDLALLPTGFAIDAGFDPADPRYAATALFMVEPNGASA